MTIHAPDDAELTESVFDTYRYLRGGTAVMVVMLAVAVIAEWCAANCWQTSISAYYYTVAHNVFVAALCGIGVLFIAYRGGTDSEGTWLNLAGIMAFIVAFVPTTAPPAGTCGVDGTILASRPAVVIDVTAIAVALVVARVGFVVLQRIVRATRKGPPAQKRKRSVLGILATVVMVLVIVVGVIAFLGFREQFYEKAHYGAAIVLFGAIIVTVVISAVLAANHDPKLASHRCFYLGAYVGLAIAMVVTVVVVFVAHLLRDDWGHWLLVVEALLIGEFAVYWLIQTVELWDVRTSVELLPADLREDTVHRGGAGTPGEILDEMRDLRRYPMRRRVLRAL